MRFPELRIPSRRIAAAVLALAALAAAPVFAQEEEPSVRQPSSLGRELLDRYEIRTEGETLVLEPHTADSAVREIEIDGDTVLVNGKSFDEVELAAFLGENGKLVAELIELSPEERLDVLGFPEIRRKRTKGDIDISVPIGDLGGPRIRVRPSGDERVSFGRRIHLEKGETASNVVCIGCSVVIDGYNSGDAVAVGGSVEVNGTVEGQAVAVGGSVRVNDGGVVEGDGVSVGGGVRTDGSGEVQGETVGVGFFGGKFGGTDDWGGWGSWGVFSDVSDLFWAILKTGFLALLSLVAFAIARPAVDTFARRAEHEPWKAAFAGLLTQLLIGPIFLLVIVVLCISIIGIPLLLLVPFAILGLFIGWFFGFVAVARTLGDRMASRFGRAGTTALLAVILGVVMIQATSLLGRAVAIPGGFIGWIGFAILALGFFLKYVAWTIGLGSMTLVALSGDWRRPSTMFVSDPVAPPPPPPADDFDFAAPPPPPSSFEAIPASTKDEPAEDEKTKS